MAYISNSTNKLSILLFIHRLSAADKENSCIHVSVSLFVVCLWLPLLFLGMEVRHAVNLIEIRLGKRWQPISNQSSVTGSPTTNKETATGGYPRVVFLRHAGLATSQL